MKVFVNGRWLLFLLLWPGMVLAAPPSADWQTLETERFRVHFPGELESWARKAAARAEAVADEVHEWVGFTPDSPVDVIIADPFNQPNGMALPLTGRARMLLFTTPPAADSVIGNYSDWPELLLIHEHVHLAHLSRPVRRSFDRFRGQLWLPAAVMPLMQSPMWVIEGYATWLEGELTGSGRPNSDLRASLIRQWAREGRLPNYGQLSGTLGQDWDSRLRAYLVGSAYFEWLAERESPQAFRDVWARQTAHTRRDFNEAFGGVFGASPAELYQRFMAETVHAALRAESVFADREVRGELWQAFGHRLGAPAVSPAGDRVAVVEYSNNEPAGLRVYRLDDNAERFEKWREAEEKKVEKDPDDVMAVRPRSLPREALHSLPAPEGRDVHDPRWIDENSILFTRLSTDAHGFASSDLFRWHLDRNRVERITEGGRLHRADPAPDGRWAVAVRYRHGYSELVRVDLADGRIQSLSEASTNLVHDQPRIHPDGQVVAYLSHAAGHWSLRLKDLNSGEEALALDAGPSSFLAQPAWSADGVLYFSRGRFGYIGVDRWQEGMADSQPVTVSVQAALAPQPIPGTDALLYLQPGPSGHDLMRVENGSDIRPGWPLESMETASPIGRQPVPLQLRAPDPSDAPARSYGRGPQFATGLMSGRWTRSETALDLGVKGGDLIGRTDWLAAASLSSRESENGALLAGSWRGWPIDLTAAAFHQVSDPSQQRDAADTEAMRQRQTGLLMGLEADRRAGRFRNGVSAGLALSEVSLAGDDYRRDWSWLQAGSQWQRQRGSRRSQAGLGLSAVEGRTEGESWSLRRGHFSLAAGRQGMAGLALSRVSLDDAGNSGERLVLGGQPGLTSTARTQPERIFEPAVPLGLLIGQEYEGQSFFLRNRSNTARLFYRRHRMGEESADEGDWLVLRGFEIGGGLTDTRLPLPELRGVRLEAGVALIQDNPLPDRTRAWVNLRYEW